jgi:hypothetical protein
MAYEARVIELMIASPSDVTAERDIIREVVHTWNAVNAKRYHLVIMPVAWETHSAPKMGERPQGVINEQLLVDADILVAAFWTRIGSPTGEEISGTIEELNRHVQAGKHAMLYFSNTTVPPEGIDHVQHSAVLAFRSECERERKGLFETYDNLDDFKKKFTRQLASTINQYFTGVGALALPQSDSVGEEDTDEIAEIIAELSDAAKQLLHDAVEVNDDITSVSFIGADEVSIGNKNYITQGDKRSSARWKNAVTLLERYTLIDDRGSQGQIYYVTDLGYKVADRMKDEAMAVGEAPDVRN